MKRWILLLAFCAFVCAMASPASASPCLATQYDMMSWFAMGSSWSTQYHLSGKPRAIRFWSHLAELNGETAGS